MRKVVTGPPARTEPRRLRAVRQSGALPALLGGLALLVVLALPACAGADVFGPISLLSAGPLEGGEAPQAEYAHDPVLSGDGRYVAFDGSLGGVAGVWRTQLLRDAAGRLRTGRIEQVAGGDAELPSTSENGRYISFTTNEGASLAAITDGLPDVSPKPEAVNVYVRDMAVPVPASGHCEAGQPCPFTVVSAPSGSVQPLTYAPNSPQAATTTGAAAIGRSAIDAAGDEVAFVTTAVSDLVPTEADRLAEAKGEAPAPETPPLQVAVRYLASDTTKLVSGRYDPATGRTTEEPAAATESSEQRGAVYPGFGVRFEASPAYGSYGSSPPPGASLSADGTTVAWMGEDVGLQAPLLSGESRPPLYTEPLWRRIASGSETPTERVTGGSDPLSPACLAGGESSLPPQPSATDPCQGPFYTPEGSTPSGIVNGVDSNFVPRLSADGYRVAFTARAALVALGSSFGRGGANGQPADLYVADMHPGLTRAQALTQVTELAGGETAGIADTAAIDDFAISPGGDQVAFTTQRTQFPLGTPAFVSPPAAEPGMAELFDADLRDGTLTRVTRSYEGGPSGHPHPPKPSGQDPYENEDDGALSPSFSASGEALVFSSTASNLVWGDGNSPLAPGGSFDGSDVFAVERQAFGSLPTSSEISPAPAGPPLAPAPELSATAVSRGDGTVALYVEVPRAGTLRATARGLVPVPAPGRSRAARRRRRPPTIASRVLALAAAPAQPGALVTLVMRPTPPYAALASQRGGLAANVTVLLAASTGGPAMRQSLSVTFLRIAHAARGRGRSARKGRWR